MERRVQDGDKSQGKSAGEPPKIFNVLKDRRKRSSIYQQVMKDLGPGNALYRPDYNTEFNNRIDEIKKNAKIEESREKLDDYIQSITKLIKMQGERERGIANAKIDELVLQHKIDNLKSKKNDSRSEDPNQQDTIKYEASRWMLSAKKQIFNIWRYGLERSEVSCRKSINSKLDEYTNFAENAPVSLQAIYRTSEASDQNPKYEVKNFEMPSFSHITLEDLKTLTRSSQGDEPTSKEIENAGAELKKHIEKLSKARGREQGIRAQEISLSIKGEALPQAGNNADSSNARQRSLEDADTKLGEIKYLYEELGKDTQFSTLMNNLADQQKNKGKPLIDAPEWAGITGKFERTYRPETKASKDLKSIAKTLQLPKFIAKSPERTAAFLALSPVLVPSAIGLSLGAAGMAIGTSPLWGAGLAIHHREAIGKGINDLSIKASNKYLAGKLQVEGKLLTRQKNLQEAKQQLYTKNMELLTKKEAILGEKSKLLENGTLQENNAQLKEEVQTKIKTLEGKKKILTRECNKLQWDLVMQYVGLGGQAKNPLTGSSDAGRASSQLEGFIPWMYRKMSERRTRRLQKQEREDGSSRRGKGSESTNQGGGEEGNSSGQRPGSESFSQTEQRLKTPTVESTHQGDGSKGKRSLTPSEKPKEVREPSGIELDRQVPGQRRRSRFSIRRLRNAFWNIKWLKQFTSDKQVSKIEQTKHRPNDFVGEISGATTGNSGLKFIEVGKMEICTEEVNINQKLKNGGIDGIKKISIDIERISVRRKGIIEKIASATAKGEHNLNEDSCFISEYGGGVCDGVSQGGRGAEASQMAKEFFERELPKLSDKIKREKLSPGQIEIELNEITYNAHNEINDKINNDIPREDRKATTTLSAIISIGDGKMMAVNVGDSRVYVLRKNGELEQITTDDGPFENPDYYNDSNRSHYQFTPELYKKMNMEKPSKQEQMMIQEKIAKMDDNQIRKFKEKVELEEKIIEEKCRSNELLVKLWAEFHNEEDLGKRNEVQEKITREKEREISSLSDSKSLEDMEIEFAIQCGHVVSRPLGSGEVEPNVVTFDVDPGDRVIITSDGVHDNLNDQEIIDCVSKCKTAEDAARALVKTAIEKSLDETRARRKLEDDTTAVVVECSREGRNNVQTSDKVTVQPQPEHEAPTSRGQGISSEIEEVESD